MAKQALPGTRANMFLMDPDEITIIGLDTKDGPEHPLYDERIHLPIDEPLVLSLMAHGNKVPIAVRKNGDAIEAVDGRQRIRCGREANKRLNGEGKPPIRLRVIPERGSDGDMFGVLILANELRQADGPLAKAEKLKRYMAMGYSEEEAAVTFGVTKTTIKNWIALLEVDPAVRNAVEAGTLPATAASKLASLSREEQKAALKEMQDSGQKATVARASSKARSKKHGVEENLAPSKLILRRIVENYDSDMSDVDAEFIRGLRYALGELAPASIRGLTSLIYKAE